MSKFLDALQKEEDFRDVFDLCTIVDEGGIVRSNRDEKVVVEQIDRAMVDVKSHVLRSIKKGGGEDIKQDDVVKLFMSLGYPFSEWSIPIFARENNHLRFELTLKDPNAQCYLAFFRNLREKGCGVVIDNESFANGNVSRVLIYVPHKVFSGVI